VPIPCAVALPTLRTANRKPSQGPCPGLCSTSPGQKLTFPPRPAGWGTLWCDLHLQQDRAEGVTRCKRCSALVTFVPRVISAPHIHTHLSCTGLYTPGLHSQRKTRGSWVQGACSFPFPPQENRRTPDARLLAGTARGAGPLTRDINRHLIHP